MKRTDLEELSCMTKNLGTWGESADDWMNYPTAVSNAIEEIKALRKIAHEANQQRGTKFTKALDAYNQQFGEDE